MSTEILAVTSRNRYNYLSRNIVGAGKPTARWQEEERRSVSSLETIDIVLLGARELGEFESPRGECQIGA